jgi:hypothetical protein
MSEYNILTDCLICVIQGKTYNDIIKPYDINECNDMSGVIEYYGQKKSTKYDECIKEMENIFLFHKTNNGYEYMGKVLSKNILQERDIVNNIIPKWKFYYSRDENKITKYNMNVPHLVGYDYTFTNFNSSEGIHLAKLK